MKLDPETTHDHETKQLAQSNQEVLTGRNIDDLEDAIVHAVEMSLTGPPNLHLLNDLLDRTLGRFKQDILQLVTSQSDSGESDH